MRTAGLVVGWMLASGCFLKLPPSTSPVEPTRQVMAPVVFTDLEQRLDVLIADTIDADLRDRLMVLRELAYSMRGQDPAAQARVYQYMSATLTIEERNRIMSLPAGAGEVPVEGVDPLGTEVGPDSVIPAAAAVASSVDRAGVVAAARGALAAGRYREAIALISPLEDAEAAALRIEAVDALARAERERAGALYLAARAEPPGPARTRTLEDAAALLRSVNAEFPSNSFSSAIADNLAQVEAELARTSK